MTLSALCVWIFAGMSVEILYTQERLQAQAALKVARARAIGNSNLMQAESKWVACLRGGIFTVGTAIYRCRAEKSELTTAQVPEVREARL